MRKFNWTLQTALEFLKDRRPFININKTFIDEIEDLLN
jgi:hypothetical protein